MSTTMTQERYDELMKLANSMMRKCGFDEKLDQLAGDDKIAFATGTLLSTLACLLAKMGQDDMMACLSHANEAMIGMLAEHGCLKLKNMEIHCVSPAGEETVEKVEIPEDRTLN